jgi:(S)-ureidoglycine aminohydrolase
MSFPHLGQTRSSHQANHLLQTPDTFVRAPLPGMQAATAIIHASPALGARFVQYTAELEPGASLGPVNAQRFLYVIEGDITVGPQVLGATGFAVIPEGDALPVRSAGASRLAVIEKKYQPIPGVPAPSLAIGHEGDVDEVALNGDTGLRVRSLVPANSAQDFAVNIMTYDPGASLQMVEIHVMEHGLLMLEGQGIYRLGDSWYPTAAGDFIWMAPYCPQWFGALGRKPAKYLIYKDWNRHPL